ncbi:MAG: hypothetical protein J1G04_00880 [Clostridiales bacterium]|nr:hypothetical protein [Clostridiales bacterium]
MKKFTLISAIAAVTTVFALVGLVGCSDKKTSPPEETPPAVEATPLDAPVIELNDNVVEWDAVDHAVSYSVYVGDDDAVTVNSTTTSYTVDKTEVGTYDIYVIANASSSGEYTDSEKSNTVTYEVFSPEVVALVRLRLVNNADKLDYFLDEVSAETKPDLTGLVVNAVYSNGSVKKVTATPEAVDFSTPGDKTVKLSYTEDGRTATTTYVITVRRRTEADIQDLITLKHEFTAAGDYKLADGTVTAVDMDGTIVPVKAEGGVSKINFQKSGSKLVKVTAADGKVSFVKVTAAIFITNTDGFLAMNNALDGYYLLRNDITFEGYSATIGTAPLKAAEGFDDERAFTYDVSGTARQGKAFTGTFDGDGYVITGYRHATESFGTADGYYLGLFGYIGEGGKVCNFVLRNSSITGGKCSAIISGVNLGTVENVTIEDDCSLSVFYAGGAVAAAYNGGTIGNIVCAPARFSSNWDGGAFVSAYESAEGAISKNVYIANKTNLTGTLGNGWYYADEIGTVYCNATYKKVLAIDTTMYKGVDGKITVFQRAVEELDFTVWVNGQANEGVLAYSSYDQDTYTYYLKLLTTASVDAGDTFAVAVRPLGKDYLNNAVTVTVGEPYVISATYDGDPIQVTAGTDLNISTITLKTTYTDGTTGTMRPLRYEGYNKGGAVGVAQEVKLFFGAGANDYVLVSVTPKAAEGDVVIGISATRKNSDRIVTDMDGAPDFDLYYTFTVTYSISAAKTVTVAGGVSVTGWVYGHNAEVTVSYGEGGYNVSDTIAMDVWAVVKSATDFAAINNNLNGYYMLEDGATIDFDNGEKHEAPIIGAVPTKVVGGDTMIDTADALEETAFNGKFDGNGGKLVNWGAPIDGYDGWNINHFGRAIFAYIGSNGEVYDFTVDNCLVQGFNELGIVSCFNKGTISGVTVEVNCHIDTVHGGLGAFASINHGNITGCTNNGATYTSTKDNPREDKSLADDGTSAH